MAEHVYALAFRFSQPEAIVAVLGEPIANKVFSKISDCWKLLTEDLLARHQIGDFSPFKTGLYTRTFCLAQESLMVDVTEQLDTLLLTSQIKVRELVFTEFGTGTGLKLDFTVAVKQVSAHELGGADINEIEDALSHSKVQQDVSEDDVSPVANIRASELNAIIEARNLDTYLQCIVDVTTNEVVGFEALTRGPKDSSVHRADQLFGSASHFGLSEPLELACVEVAIKHINTLPEPFFLTINTGPKVLLNEQLLHILQQPEITPHLHRIIFEITEHLPIEDVKGLLEKMQQYTDMGVRFALDDTGCGFFDLSTAEVLSPAIVKLCISVIRQIDESGEITKEIAQTREKLDRLDAFTLGEGVEEQYQLEALKQAGVQFYQGYLFDKPMPVKEKLAHVT